MIVRINAFMRGIALAMTLYTPAAFAENAFVVISDVDDIKTAYLAELPPSPENGMIDRLCTHYREEPRSDEARSIVDLDWILTSERRLGRYVAITFASGFNPGAKGTCFARNANLAIFENSRLRALAYTTKQSGRVLGTLRKIEGGALLIGSDGPGAPQAEIRELNDGVRIADVAAEATFCGGQVTVPNIYKLSIKDARVVLKKAGWMPSPSNNAFSDLGWEGKMVREGIIEVDICSGEAQSFCAYGYKNKLGTLGVTTMGGSEDSGSEHLVIGYAATCSP